MAQPTCRDCGLEIPVNAPGGRCPNCLFGFALTPGPDDDDGGETVATGAPRSPAAAPRKRILGGYELLEELAQGGMGVVWKARQFGLNRLVALKMLHAGSLASAQAQLRFRMEVEAVARLSHPNIVTFYEAGEDEGIHFYTMTLVETGTLASQLSAAAGRPSLRALARTLVKICRAVEFAHRHGILHRDLKPSNILIDRHGEPLVADFGLARSLLPDSSLTASGAVLGSPHYMAPEQAGGDPPALSTATDVYSLGAILYECATGTPPFRAATPLEVLDQVRRSDPVPPSAAPGFHGEVSRSSDRDFDTIVLKCLRKDPSARYASAADLAEELERWLAGRPIAARPMGTIERSWRWCRREPARAVAAGAAVLLGIVTLAGTLVHTARMSAANRRIAAQASQLRDQNQVLRLREAESLFEDGESARAVATLASVVRSAPENGVASARLQSALQLRAFPRLTSGAAFQVGTLCAEGWAAGRGMVTVTADGAARFWDPDTGASAGSVSLGSGEVSMAVVGLGGHCLAAASGTFVRLLRLDAGTNLLQLEHASRVTSLVIDPAERWLVTLDDSGALRVWDAGTGRLAADPIEAGRALGDVAVSSSASPRVVAVDDGQRLVAWDVASGRMAWERTMPGGASVRLAVSPDGSRVAVASNATVEVLDGKTGQIVGKPAYFPGAVNRMEFAGDSSRLAVSCDGLSGDSAHVWEFATAEPPGPPLRHRDRITLLQFSRDGRRLLTGSHDRTASIWEVSSGRRACEPMVHPRGLTGARFSPDDTAVVTSTFAGWVTCWRLPGPPDVESLKLGEPVLSAVISADGTHVAAGGIEGAIKVWSIGGAPQEVLAQKLSKRAWQVEFSPDGRRVAGAFWDGAARIWNLADSREVTLRHDGWSWVMSVHHRPDGRRVVTAGHDRTARVWDAETGQALLVLQHPVGVSDAVYSPDGRYILTRGMESTARLWDAETGELISDRLVHASWVDTVAFASDGASMLTASRDTTARLWRWDSGAGVKAGQWEAPEPAIFESPARIERAALSADGRQIAGAVGGHSAILWNTGSRAPRQFLNHAGPVYDARFDSDGGRVVTASGDRTARVWSTRTGQPMSEPLRHEDLVYVSMFTPDDSRVMTAGGDGWVRLWPAPRPPRIAPGWLPELAERMAALRGETGTGFQVPETAPSREVNEWFDQLRRSLPPTDAARSPGTDSSDKPPAGSGR